MLLITCQAIVSIGPLGSSLWWAALTEVEVALIVIQGVIVRADTGWLRAHCVVLRESVAGVGGQWLRLGRDEAHLGLRCTGGPGGVVYCDLREGFLGVLVLGLGCGLGLNAGHRRECHHDDG